jgi:hypothetical protein
MRIGAKCLGGARGGPSTFSRGMVWRCRAPVSPLRGFGAHTWKASSRQSQHRNLRLQSWQLWHALPPPSPFLLLKGNREALRGVDGSVLRGGHRDGGSLSGGDGEHTHTSFAINLLRLAAPVAPLLTRAGLRRYVPVLTIRPCPRSLTDLLPKGQVPPVKPEGEILAVVSRHIK